MHKHHEKLQIDVKCFDGETFSKITNKKLKHEGKQHSEVYE
jgi:hypothetical protein